jgi:peptidoglycan/xylan/chitin deacetylase (PgdA/CDA1 family)/GT2 family glycosyltransferase
VNRPGICVVVTCCDLGRMLEEALESVARQTRQAAECVIVNDGSVDVHTLQVLGRLRDAGQTVLSTPNRGVSAARNTGVRATCSPYVVLLDADDVLEPEYFERAAALLDDDASLSFVSCGMHSFGDADEVWVPPHPDLIRSLSGEVVHISSMFRRELWKETGGFDESLRGHEDVDFWVAALARGLRGQVIQDALLRYRVRPRSTSRRAIEHDAHLALMRRIYEKHLPSLVDRADELILQKERFALSQEAHSEQLRARIRGLETQRASLHAEIAAIEADLISSGVAPVELGDLRRTTPISDAWGTDRGEPVDRYYIHAFLDEHRRDIRGHVLEVKDSGYTRLFGDDRVSRSDVLDVDETNEEATIVVDLTAAGAIADDTFDCFILTQTLGLIYEPARAVAEAVRVLKPGGVLLCTLPAAGRISYEDRHLDGDFWRFTEASVRRIFADLLPADAFEVRGYGNVLACTAFLYGMANHELEAAELEAFDPFFPLVYAARAVKPLTSTKEVVDQNPTVARNAVRSESLRAAILMYHRVAVNGEISSPICLSPAVFNSHMRYLRDRGHTVVSLAELRDGLSRGRMRDGCVALTFDDGYAEMLSVVAPILAGYRYPFTAFVVGQSLNGPVEFWWDTLWRVFQSTPELPPSFSIELRGKRLEIPTRTGAEREAASAQIAEALYQLSNHEREAVIATLLDWSRAGAPIASPRPMSASELLALSKLDGAAIGAHTENHVWLPAESPEEQLFQITETKARLESLIGRAVTSFAYPFGVWCDANLEMVSAAGFLEAVTTEERTARGGNHPLLLPRIDMGGCGASEFADRLTACLDGRVEAGAVRVPST